MTAETDLISRQAAIDALLGITAMWNTIPLDSAIFNIKKLPSAQPEPSEITEEQAILHLQSTGWMQNHDREMYESGLRERLADDSDSYDALLPSAQPERKKGKWIPKEDRAKQEVFICSVCGGWAYSPWIGSRKNHKPNWCKYLFCPNCGAEMRKETEDA